MSGEDTISGYGDSILEQKTATISLKVVDSADAGCAGKTPTSVGLFRAVDGAPEAGGDLPSLVPVPETEASLHIATVPTHSRARLESVFTGYDGIIQVNVYFAFINANASAYSFYVRFEFDGGAASSRPVGPLVKDEPADQRKTAAFVSSLTTISPPPQELVVKRAFSVVLQLRNPEGSTAELVRLAKAEGLKLMICQVTFIVHAFCQVRWLYKSHICIMGAKPC